MIKRDVVIKALRGEPVPYTPWDFSFTEEALLKLNDYYGEENLADVLNNHIVSVGGEYFEKMEQDCYKDVFGVIWDRSQDKDIGIVKELLLKEPEIGEYEFPAPDDERFKANIVSITQANQDKFKVFNIGFSLFERAWTLRGMENLLMDFYDNPGFIKELLNQIGEHNIARIKEGMVYGIDAVRFGDDWGQQQGLIMGPAIWYEFIYPVLKKMYKAVKDKGKYVFIHSCGDVDELFDDLIDIGLDCFNPFQPEVIDVIPTIEKYRGRLSFHGGLSTQRTLPYGSMAEVKREAETLIQAGLKGNYMFAPAHATPGDVPVENMVAFIDAANSQLSL